MLPQLEGVATILREQEDLPQALVWSGSPPAPPTGSWPSRPYAVSSSPSSSEGRGQCTPHSSTEVQQGHTGGKEDEQQVIQIHSLVTCSFILTKRGDLKLFNALIVNSPSPPQITSRNGKWNSLHQATFLCAAALPPETP